MKLFSSSSGFKVYFADIWNRLNTLAIILFIVGFSIHCAAQSTNQYYKNNIFDISR
jgi:hypothetical protein